MVIGRKSQAPDNSTVEFEAANFLPAGDVPQNNCAVECARSDILAIGRKRQTENPAGGLPQDRVLGRQAFEIPKSDRAPAGGGESAAVRAHGEVVNLIG